VNTCLSSCFGDTGRQMEWSGAEYSELSGQSSFKSLGIFNIKCLRLDFCARFQCIELRLRAVDNGNGILACGSEKIGNGGTDFACADNYDLFHITFPLECNSDMQESHSSMQKEAYKLTI